MSFDRPLALLLLLAPSALLAASFAARRRRARYAVRFTNLDVLRQVASGAAGRRQRAVAGLTLAALVLLCLAVARPHALRSGTIENATVVLVVDTSRSMLADDVAPTRLAAAKAAARSFLERAERRLRVGVVTFSGDVNVAAFPTHDRDLLRRTVEAISPFRAGRGTAIGDALGRAVEVARDAFAEPGAPSPRTGAIPGAEGVVSILFLSDGRQNRGLLPAAAGAELAARARIPVYTVALGSDEPDRLAAYGGFNRMPDRATLRAIARATGGEYFAARSADALASAYGELGSRLGRGKRRTEVTFLFVAAAAAALAAGAALGRLWEPALP